MNKEIIDNLRNKILKGLQNLSKSSFQYKNEIFQSYLNTYILLAIKLNYSYIDEPQAILKSIPHHIDEPNIVNITNGLSELGFITKKHSNCSDISKLAFPCLLMEKSTVSKDNIKVLFRENDTIICYDPFSNTYTAYNEKKINKKFCIYTFEKFDEEHFELSKGVLKFLDRSWFVALLARFKTVIIKLILVSTILHVFSLVLPLYIIYTYSRVIVSHDTSNLATITFFVIFLLICEQILRYFRANILSWLGSRVDYIVTNEVLTKLNRLPLSIIEKLSLPSQIARIRSFSSLRDFFTGPIFSMILELPAILLMIIMISYFHYVFTLIFAVGFIMLFICLMFFHHIISRQIKKTTSLNTEKYYLTSIYLDKLSTLHYQGLERFYLNKLHYLSEQAAIYNLHADFSSGFIDNYGKFITNTGILLTLCAGIFLIWHNEISVAVLLATIFLSWRIFNPIQVASSTMIRSEKFYRTIKQIDNFLALPDEDDNQENFSKSINIHGDIRLLNVGVLFNSNKNFVLRNFSLKINPGQLVVIHGNSGSGKSTVLKLISGFIKPNIGKVLIDGYDISQLNIRSLRSQICHVYQSENYIPGTIYENIQLANPFFTDKEIDELFEQLHLLDEINKFPEGLNTYITPENKNFLPIKLLGYINIAKLYISPAPVKLLDGLNREVFSTKTWEVIINDIRKWKENFTMVFVTDEKSIHEISDVNINLSKKN